MTRKRAPTSGIGHNRGPTWPSRSSVPPDAVALIRRPTRSVMTSGKARARQWILTFERRTPPFIEPLMGWTGGDDTLAQVELSFPTRAAAIAFAEREGLTYRLQGEPHLRGVGQECLIAPDLRHTGGARKGRSATEDGKDAAGPTKKAKTSQRTRKLRRPIP
jgi:hypothetical protein